MTASSSKKKNTMTDYHMSMSLHNITKVKAEKSTYDDFISYDLSIEGNDGRIITITLFSVGRNNIAFEDGDNKDRRST